MYLPLNTKEQADERNRFEAFKRGCHPPTIYWWSMPIEYNGQWCLDVLDGDGLSEEELSRCIIVEEA